MRERILSTDSSICVPCVDEGLGRDVSGENQVDAGLNGPNRGLAEIVVVRDRPHGHRVRDDDAVEPEFRPEQLREELAGERRRAVGIEAIDDDVRRHDTVDPGLDHRLEGREVDLLQCLSVVGDVGNLVMGVRIGVSVSGEMLRHRDLVFPVDAVEERSRVLRDRLRIAAGRPDADDRISGVSVDVDDRPLIHVHSDR